MKTIKNYFFIFFFIFILKIIFFYDKKIKVAIYYYNLSNGGIQRITALLTNYLSKKSIFDIYIFLNEKAKNEYIIPTNVKKRYLPFGTNLLIKELRVNHIDIFIYQLYNVDEIKILNNLENIKVIIIIHCTFLSWFYSERISFFKNIYNEYKNSKYIVSLIPFENDYLFNKWGINSILLNNFITYDYDNISPSDLSSKTILMIGRVDDERKRFDLGIKAMKYISKIIPECEMKIISKTDQIQNLTKLVRKLELEKKIKFVGYTTDPSKYFKNASLNIISSFTESFSMVLCETKVYGIPNIITGFNYVKPARGGVINVIDDDPKTIAKEAIKILSNEKYRKQLGYEARKSMATFRNSLTTEKWIELIRAIYRGEKSYKRLKEKDKKISEAEAISILKTQIELLKKRFKKYKNITIEKLINIIN